MSLLDSLATSLASFRSDDTLVDIVPSFDLPEKLALSSNVPLGPFQAGIVAKAPLWIAILLEQRSFARISPPSWLTTENISEIIAIEQQNTNLFHDETGNQLPRNYYELCQRLGKRSLEHNADAITLLVQDLLDIRLDKLRGQFSTYMKNSTNGDPDIVLEFHQMGTYEIAVLQEFVVTALADQHALATTAISTAKTSATTITEDGTAPNVARRSRKPLRKRLR